MGAPAQVVTRRVIEKIPKCPLLWLKNLMPTHVDETWRAQVTGVLNKCIDAYDDIADGYIMEYHQKVYGEEALARQWASCGMQHLYRAFRAVVAKTMSFTDWDIVNCHSSLLMQMCPLHNIKCLFAHRLYV